MNALSFLALAMVGPATDPRSDYFETSVRPLLARHCQSCHGPKKSMGGLRLDHGHAARAGGDTGPAVVPGNAAESLLVQAVRYDGDLKMPPKGRLSDEEIAVLTQWVAHGAYWPNDKPAEATPAELARTHWAFQPVRAQPVPATPPEFVRTSVDAFVVDALRRKGLTPSPPAGRRVLLRRITFDLLGLPPTPDEIEAFVNDPADDDTAYDAVVERLLASPHYGERWGRHWLDVARYADTRGYLTGGQERKYAYSYTYRDYVIQAFNDDLPYDQFIRHQLAADQFAPPDDPRSLAAMGFLTLGRRFIDNAHDIIDDRIDVVTRGLLGLTVSCARCHDHKYDPIPTIDYYSLYGVFHNSTEPQDLPLLARPEQSQEYLEFEKQLRQLEADVEAYKQTRRRIMEEKLRQPAEIARYLMAAREAKSRPNKMVEIARERDVKSAVLQRWTQFLNRTRREKDELFATWHRLSDAGAEAFAAERPADWELAWAFAETSPTTPDELAVIYGELLARRPEKIARDDGPARVPDAEIEASLGRDERNQLRALKLKVDKWKANSPAAPPRAHVLVDAPKPSDVKLFVRGNPSNPGPVAPRRFLEVVSGPARPAFRHGSGRRELAEAIASPDNPLTARVLVNRIWHWHFGRGLVATTSDFGLRGEPPTHPELLDHLADEFVRGGWSIKRLHRLIVSSRTYRQSSDDRPDCSAVDPENLLLWRSPRRRLEFEALRDAMLAASGSLDLTLGGRPVDITRHPSPPRRTVYAFIDRQNLPGVFPAFDFASPNLHTPYRFTTTVPQQALYLMNGPFAREQASKLAGRPEIAAAPSPEDKVRALYRIVLGRLPNADEVRAGVEFAGDAADNWTAYAQLLMMSNEFAFVD